MIGVGRSRIQDQVAVAVAVGTGRAVAGALAVAVAGLTKIFSNHIQKDFLINVWGGTSCPITLHIVEITRQRL